MKGLIVSSGQVNDLDLLKKIANENDYIVCADGGVNHLLKINILPDIVLGDLDSIGKKELSVLKEEKIEIKKFPSKKDLTDTELCVDYLLEKGFKEITLMGVTGSRIDHMIANIYLLKKIYRLGAKPLIIDKNNRIYYTEGVISIKNKKDFFVSILPLNEDGAVVTLNGFLYSLEKVNLEFGSTRGISNLIIKEYGQVKIHRGSALIIQSTD